MPSRATIGRLFIQNSEKQRGAARFLPPWPRKHLYFQSLRRNPDARREQKNRENKRTITGAYQGDIRREISGGKTGAAGYREDRT
jgi:hypothetical protein